MAEPKSTLFWVQLSVRYGFLDELYQLVFIQPVRQVAGRLYRFDQRRIDGLVDGLGMSTVVLAHMVSWADRYLVDGVVNGAVWVANQSGRLTRSVQSGRVQSYIATAVMVLLVLLWWLL